MAVSAPSPRQSRIRAVAGAAVGVLLVLALAACGGDSGNGGATGTTTTTAPDTDGGSTVVAKDFSLTSLTVAAAANVTFQNSGQVPHTMTADEGAFDSNAVDPGSSAKVAAPTTAGAYAFHCKIHPSMTATLTVKG